MLSHRRLNGDGMEIGRERALTEVYCARHGLRRSVSCLGLVIVPSYLLSNIDRRMTSMPRLTVSHKLVKFLASASSRLKRRYVGVLLIL